MRDPIVTIPSFERYLTLEALRIYRLRSYGPILEWNELVDPEQDGPHETHYVRRAVVAHCMAKPIILAKANGPDLVDQVWEDYVQRFAGAYNKLAEAGMLLPQGGVVAPLSVVLLAKGDACLFLYPFLDPQYVCAHERFALQSLNTFIGFPIFRQRGDGDFETRDYAWW